MRPPTRFMQPLLLHAASFLQLGSWPHGANENNRLKAPLDLWAGDATQGKKLLGRQFHFAGCEINFPQKIVWYAEEGSIKWLETLHGFSWLRDIVAFNKSTIAAAAMREYILDWIEHAATMHTAAHYPEIMGERVANWIVFARFFLKDSSFAFRRKFLRSLTDQIKQLELMVLTRPGIKASSSRAGFCAVRGLVFAALSRPFAHYLLKPSVSALYYLIESRIMADGGHQARSPSVQLDVLKTLIEIQQGLKQVKNIRLQKLDTAVAGVAAMLRSLLHGDGRLALFNNSIMENRVEIAEVLARTPQHIADSKLPAASGFHRLHRADTLVIMDAGTPVAAHSASHYGTLSFELSDGAERIIVNCGAYRGNDFAWRKVPRSTAAHSTLSIDERNSWDVSNANRTDMPRVNAMRGERDGNIFVDAVYNGYVRYAGLTHSRQLYLTADGTRLSGADILTAKDGEAGKTPHQVTLRFHTHPLIQLERYFDGAVRLTTASGIQWVFQSSHQHRSTLEESVFLGEEGKPVRTSQIVITLPMESSDQVIEWAFSKL